MTNLFVKYDVATEKVICGPQGLAIEDTRVPFIPAQNLKARQAYQSKWSEELGVVFQVAGDEHAPDYREQRRIAYPNLGEQLDKLFHDIDSGTLDKTGSFYEIIKAVKDEIPRPS